VGTEEGFFFLFFHAPIVSKACSLVNVFYKSSNTLMDHYPIANCFDLGQRKTYNLLELF
jgi:hypothetical protein